MFGNIKKKGKTSPIKSAITNYQNKRWERIENHSHNRCRCVCLTTMKVLLEWQTQCFMWTLFLPVDV